MELYHASGQVVEFPEIRKSKYTKEFSWGLYCTNNYEQAKKWALRNREYPTINYYDYQEAESLNILKFEKMCDGWLDFIAECRKGYVHDYDIVEGPMAEVNYCLSFEQVSEELIEYFNIKEGKFDTVSSCKYDVPSYIAIGKEYQRLILNVRNKEENIEDTTFNVFASFISDDISNFNSSVYYSSPDYLRCSYLEGKLLA